MINISKGKGLKEMNKFPRILLILLILELLCGVSCMFKGKLTDKERDLLKNIEKFNRDYGSKGVTIKNREIDWDEKFVCNGLILKNSLIKNVELVMVDLRNTYIEDSVIENVSISEKSDLRGSTFKNVKFKNFKCINNYALPSRLRNSIFIDCEFINCEYSYVTLGKEYRNCKFTKIKEIEEVSYYDTIVTDSIFTNCELNSGYGDARFENVIFKDGIVRGAFSLRNGKSKNIQFINCLTRFGISGNIENILIQNSKPNDDAEIGFEGDMKNIIIKDCPEISRFIFKKGVFNNVSIINCKYPVTGFYNVKLSNLLIKDSIVQHFKFEESDVSGENRVENSEIWGNFYDESKVRNLTIANCKFKFYVNIALSELIRLRLVNNIYESQAKDHPRYPGEVRYAVVGERFIDSDKFPLESTPFPEHIQRYYENGKKINK